MSFTIPNTVTDLKTNLGLGTAAEIDVGTGASEIVLLDSEGKLPAVDASQLTNINQGNFNNPAFQYSSDTDTNGSGAWTNLNALGCTTEDFDTSSGDYNTSNGHFTPTTAGYYVFYAHAAAGAGTDGNLRYQGLRFIKNDVVTFESWTNEKSYDARRVYTNGIYITYMNGTSDYCYWQSVQVHHTGTPNYFANQCWFGGFRLG